MKYAVDRVLHEQESRSITIFLDDDIKFNFMIDNQGFIQINKVDFQGSNIITIEPCVSNQIRIK